MYTAVTVNKNRMLIQAFDVKVDAITGAILKSDLDNDKEEDGKIEKNAKFGDKDNLQHEDENEDSANHED